MSEHVVDSEVCVQWEVVSNDETPLSAPCRTPEEAMESFRELWQRGMRRLWPGTAEESVAGVRQCTTTTVTSVTYGPIQPLAVLTES